MTIYIKSKVITFFKKYSKILMLLTAYLVLFFIVPYAFAGTTGGDLASVDKHVSSEVQGDIMDILGWCCFGLGCIGAVAKMSMSVVITMFGIFLVLTLGPTVISTHFSALI